MSTSRESGMTVSRPGVGRSSGPEPRRARSVRSRPRAPARAATVKNAGAEIAPRSILRRVSREMPASAATEAGAARAAGGAQDLAEGSAAVALVFGERGSHHGDGLYDWYYNLPHGDPEESVGAGPDARGRPGRRRDTAARRGRRGARCQPRRAGGDRRRPASRSTARGRRS